MTAFLELWLVRHGETVANANKRISGWTNVPLSVDGEAQAKAIRPLLSAQTFDGVWSSDLHRAVHTAKLAYGPPVTDKRIREMHFGDLEDQHWESADPRHTQALLKFEDFQAPGGENLNGFRQRLMDFVSSLPMGRHLIFTHGGVIRMLTKELGLDRFVKNAGVLKINWTTQTLLSVDELSWAKTTASGKA